MFVVFGHCIADSPAVNWFSSFFMPLFFLCSGLCYKSPVSLKATVAKTLTPYYVWGMIGFGMQMLLSLLQRTFTIEKAAGNLLAFLLGMKMWNYPLWFLVAFFVCKIFFDTIMRFCDKQTAKWLLWFLSAMLFLVGLGLSHVKNHYVFFFPFRFDTGVVMMLFMVIGYRAQKLLQRLQISCISIKLLCMTVCLAVNLGAFFINTPISVSSSQYGDPVLFLLSSLGGSGFILTLGILLEPLPLLRRILSWWGVHSLDVMCIHVFVLMVVTKGLLILSTFFPIRKMLFDALNLTLTLLGVVAFCKVLDFLKFWHKSHKNIKE